MSDHDPSSELPNPGEGRTEEYPTLAGTLTAPSNEAAPVDDAADADEEWASRGPARGIRLAVPIAALLAVVLVAGGFWGGAALEKSHNGGSAGGAASLASRFRALRGGAAGRGTTGAAGATGASGFAFPGAGGSAGTTGTISVVAGNTLYILSSTGSLVKVLLSNSTTVTRNAATKPIDLRPGDTVVVQGATSTNGTVTASSVAATGPGVSAAGGGFGFGGGGGAGAATSTTAGG